MIDQLWRKLELPQNIAARLRDNFQNPFRRLLLAFVGGIFAWMVHLTFVYGLTSLTCEWGWFASTPNRTGLQVSQLIATLVTVAVLLYLTYIPLRELRHQQSKGHNEKSQAIAGRDSLLAFVTLSINALFLLIVVVSVVPIVMLPPCS